MLATLAVAAAALMGSASAFPLNPRDVQAAVERGEQPGLKARAKAAAPFCCANNQDGSYVLLNSTSFVVINEDGSTYHPKMVNLATQYSRLGARLIQFFDDSHALLSSQGTYIAEQPSGQYVVTSWNSTSCSVSNPVAFPLPVMCFGDGYIWNKQVGSAHFLIGHRNLTVFSSDVNQGSIYIDNEFCAPVGMDTAQGVGTYFNSYVGILPDAWWALPSRCNSQVEAAKAKGLKL